MATTRAERTPTSQGHSQRLPTTSLLGVHEQQVPLFGVGADVPPSMPGVARGRWWTSTSATRNHGKWLFPRRSQADTGRDLTPASSSKVCRDSHRFAYVLWIEVRHQRPGPRAAHPRCHQVFEKRGPKAEVTAQTRRWPVSRFAARLFRLLPPQKNQSRSGSGGRYRGSSGHGAAGRATARRQGRRRPSGSGHRWSTGARRPAELGPRSAAHVIQMLGPELGRAEKCGAEFQHPSTLDEVEQVPLRPSQSAISNSCS